MKRVQNPSRLQRKGVNQDFDGDNDGSGAMLPWICVFGGLQRKIETVKMKKKKMKKKN
jgi:hypothetical protein